MLLDCHCHIDLFDNPFQMINQITSNRIFTIAVSNTPKMYLETASNIVGNDYVKPALGIHPMIREPLFHFLPDFKKYVSDALFIGEIGLDGTASKESQIQQQEVLDLILQECSEKNCIISLHSRKKESLLLDMVNRHLKCKVIFHWFSGSKGIAEKIVEEGHYFSINLLMLKTESTRMKLKSIPKERILTESDGPFAKYQGKVLSPLNIYETLCELASFWSTTKSEAEIIVEKNFRALAESNKVILDI